MYKQVIVLRADLNLSRGKLAVQAAHAAIIGCELSNKNIVEKWKLEGQKKIALSVRSERELFELRDRARKLGLVAEVVRDAGLTEVPAGTPTALVIGPDEESKIDKVTGNLPLFK
ncbi:MAG: peptidyl-tRNA hydrolase [Archaeoglobus sp.]|nr:MAG: peptidyl-tRNA hydrolase [Archaeoglobus sp.]